MIWRPFEAGLDEGGSLVPIVYRLSETFGPARFHALSFLAGTGAGSTPVVQVIWLNRSSQVRFLAGTPALAAGASSTISVGGVGAQVITGNVILLPFPPDMRLVVGDRLQISIVGGLGSDILTDGLLTLLRGEGKG